MTSLRIPTDREYRDYDGGHCKVLWSQTPESWCCPGCGRNKRDILRWTLRTPNGRRFRGWIAPLCKHHDHSGYNRFSEVIVCGDCNSADAAVKRKLKLPSDWSFSAGEIRQFVKSIPHGKHTIDYQKAKDIYLSLQ